MSRSAPPRRPPTPRIAKPSSEASASPPSALIASTTDAIRSDSLWRSSSAPLTTVSPSANAPARATSGSSSIASGTSPAATLVARSVEWRASTAPWGSPPDGIPSSTSIAAPIRFRIPSSPTRVGFRPTPSSRTRLPGMTSAATMRNAADEKSPGTLKPTGSSRSAGRTAIRRGGSVAPDRQPGPRRLRGRRARPPPRASARCGRARARARSPRSSPSAARPASRTHDLTWALATGSRYEIPCRREPLTLSGGRRSSRASTFAPISRSGRTTRSTGRRRIDSSPSSVHSPASCPASHPGSRRRRVPALPTSIASGSAPAPAPGPRNPIPSTLRSSAPDGSASVVSTPAPSARTASSVERVSAESRYRLIRDSPSAIAARSAARCEIDLSGGGRRDPRSGPAGSKRAELTARSPAAPRYGPARARPRPPGRRRLSRPPRARSPRSACRPPDRGPCPRC